MEQKQISLEKIYLAIQNIQQELHEIKENLIDDEGELTDEVKKELEERRKTPLSEYIDLEDVEDEL